MAYSWKDNLPDGGAIPENSAGDPLATLTADDGTTDAVSYGIGAGSDGYGNALFKIDNNGVLSPKTMPADYLDDYEDSILVQYRADRLFTATVNAYSAEGEVVASRLFVLTLQDVNDVNWVENPAIYGGNGTIAENTDPATALATFNATDDDASATVTYSLDSSATDATFFNIDASTGILTAKSAFNFEHASHDNSYHIRVIANSDDASLSITQDFRITITNVDEQVEWQTAPTGNAGEVLENIAIGTSVAAFVSTDPEGGVAYYGLGSDYGFDGGHQDAYFNLNLQTGELTTKSELNFEEEGITNGHYTILALSQAGDGHKGVISELFILTLTNIENEELEWVGTPSTATSIAENDSTATAIGIFAASDTDNNSLLTYSLATGGADNSYFSINAETGELSTTGAFDFEDSAHANGLYTAIVNATATEGSTPVLSRRYVLTITDVDERIEWQTTPTGNADVVLENIAIDTVLATFVSTDPEGAESYYGVGDDYGFVGGHQDSYFSLDLYTGELITKAELDYEKFTHYTILALSQARDKDLGVGVISELFVLTLTDVDNTTAFTAGGDGKTIAENNVVRFDAGDRIDDFGNNGATAPITYGLSGDDADYFSIGATTGWLFVKSSFDYENPATDNATNRYSVTIIANADAYGDPVTKLFVLTIADQAVEWSSTPSTGTTFAENNAVGFGPIPFNAIEDGGATITYSLSGTDAAYFSINADNGGVYAASSFNFEDSGHTDGLYTVTVNATATDDANTPVLSTLFVLTITNVDEVAAWQTNPTGNADVVSENIAIGTSVADFSATDPEGVAINGEEVVYGLGAYFPAFGLDGGSQGQFFNIDIYTGELTTKSALDFETQEHYTLNVLSQARDKPLGTGVISHIFVLTLTDVDNTTAFTAGSGGKTIAENNVVSFISTDRIDDFGNGATPSGVKITYSLSGDDADYFSIGAPSGWLFVTSSFDYENPANATNLYSVTIHANATKEGTEITRNFVLTVTDVAESTAWQNNGNPSGAVLAENNNADTSLADFGATDGDGAAVTYSLSGADNAYFNINATTGVLTAKSAFDLEDGNRSDGFYSVVVNANSTDDSPAITQTFILTITNVDEPVEWQTAPTGNAGEVLETIAIGTSVADFGATTPEGGVAYYGLGSDYNIAGGHQDAYFNLDLNTGELTTKSGLDFETLTHYTIMVVSQAVAGDKAAISQLFILTVTDVENVTAFTNTDIGGFAISENNAVGFADGDSIIDFDDNGAGSITYGLSGGAAAYFSIDTDGLLFIASSLDYESTYGQANDNRYSITITANATEEGTAVTRNFILTVTDINETLFWEATGNPAGNAIDENNSATTSVADFGATHTDGSTNITYSLESGGADNSYFAINAVTGILSTSSSFDFEDSHDPRYSVVVFATPTDDGSATSQTFILTITDADEFTTGWENNGNPVGNTISENLAIGTSLADFNATDGDGGTTVTYSVASDIGDGSYFAINSTNGVLTTKSIFDFENPDKTDGLYSVTVRANSDDASPQIEQIFVLTIGNVDNTPDWNADTATGVTRNENTNDTTLWDFRNDDPLPDGVSLTYGLSGVEAGRFTIGPRDGGEYWRFRGGGDYDFESEYGQSINNRYSVIITANATVDGDAISRVFILTIGDVNESPEWSITPATGTTFAENNDVGFGPIAFNATDGGGATVTYSLSGTDAAYFSIDADDGGVYAASSFDFEDSGHTDGLYTITVNATATDGNPVALSHTFILTITNVNEPVEWTQTRGGNEVAENSQSSTLFDFNAADPEGATVTYGIRQDHLDSELFVINATTGVLGLNQKISFEDRPVTGPDNRSNYSVVVQANSLDDNGNAPIEQIYILSIIDLPEQTLWAETRDSAIFNKSSTIAENNTIGGLLEVFSAYDQDNGTTISYSLLDAITNSGDSNYFSINSETGQLYATSSFDFEDTNRSGDNSYNIVIAASPSDASSGAIYGVLRLTITNENEFTTGWENNGNPVGNTISENLAVGTSVADFNATDGDTVPVTYSLTHHPDAEYFAIDSNGVLTITSSFDFENPANATNRYSVIVSATSIDGSDAVSQHFVLTIANVSENETVWAETGNTASFIKSSTIAENNTAGDLIAVFSAYDDDTGTTITYSLFDSMPGSGDSNYFSINAETGQVYAKSSFDFEDPNRNGDNSYLVVIQAYPSDVTADNFIVAQLFLNVTDVDGAGLAPDPTTPDQPVGINGKVLFDGDTDNLGGINDGIGNDGLVIIGNDLSVTQYDSVSATNTDLIITNVENFEQSFVGYTDADGNDQNHWFFVRDDATDNTGHIVFDADGLDVNLESLANGGATTTPDQINLLAGLNFGNDGDFAKPDDLNLDLNGNNAASLTHDQFLALIGGSNNIDFI